MNFRIYNSIWYANMCIFHYIWLRLWKCFIFILHLLYIYYTLYAYDSVGLGWVCGICISENFPGHVSGDHTLRIAVLAPYLVINKAEIKFLMNTKRNVTFCYNLLFGARLRAKSLCSCVQSLWTFIWWSFSRT